jgi:hypothetical protein
VIQSAGLLDQDAVTMTLTTATGGTTSGTMSSQLASTTVWPPSGANTPGQHVKIAVKYPYQSFLGILWNGASGSQTIYLSASSSEPIQF